MIPKTFLGRILAAIFLLAIIMGPGPGLYLASPSADVEPTPMILGVPVLYAWVVFWFFVQAVVIIIASCKLWEPMEDPGE